MHPIAIILTFMGLNTELLGNVGLHGPMSKQWRTLFGCCRESYMDRIN
jgi:hypothetical protein